MKSDGISQNFLLSISAVIFFVVSGCFFGIVLPGSGNIEAGVNAGPVGGYFKIDLGNPQLEFNLGIVFAVLCLVLILFLIKRLSSKTIKIEIKQEKGKKSLTFNSKSKRA